jgi:hypothetical protein
MAKAYKNIRSYISKFVLISHSHIYVRIHEDFEELFLGYRGFLEFFEGPGDVAEILWVLGIDVMVNEEGD